MSEASAARLLAIDTSSRRGSVAIDWEGQRLQAELKDNRAHASDLLPELHNLLQAVGAERVHGALPFSAIIVGVGPGSYTGLRIGIATARALAWASGARLLGVSSFEALAHGALGSGQRAAIAQDARAGKFYFARYERHAVGLSTLDAPQLMTAVELRGALEHESIILGDAGLMGAAGLNESTAARFRPDAWPCAESLLCLGQLRLGEPHDLPVEPLYLRAFGE